MIPTLQTERLRLRPATVDDWPDYAGLMTSQRAVHMGGPHTLGTAWGMFCNDVAQWSLFGHGCLMIEERRSGVCVGQVGVNAGPLFPERELGWFLYAQAEGKGYAFEAASEMRDWAFAGDRPGVLVSYIRPDNLRSRKLAERLGARHDPEAEGHEQDDLVFRYQDPRLASFF